MKEDSNNKNLKIIKEFEKLIEQIKSDIDRSPSKKESMVNFYRLRQLKNALAIIMKFSKEIKKGEDLQEYKGIGQGTISRINEILKTGRLSEIIPNEYKDFIKPIEELEQIFGIGRKKAFDLVKNYNIKSIPELINAYKKGKVSLTEQMLLGLKYHGKYLQNIPRVEVMEIDKLIHKIGSKVDPDLHIVVCGSYRRLKLTSNDIDVLIVHPKIKTELDLINKDNYLIKFIAALKKIKFLLDDLTFEDYKKKYMGFCQLNKDLPVRRIDFMYVPYDSYYTALLHFTGPGDFNRKMRELAIQLDYHLSEKGLFKEPNMKPIKIKSEKDVFERLGLEYLPPELRF